MANFPQNYPEVQVTNYNNQMQPQVQNTFMLPVNMFGNGWSLNN